MTRARWFHAEWTITLRALASRMKMHVFTEGSQDGFFLERTREDRIEGRYVEKLSYKETFPDPFGQELTFDRISYRQVEFVIYRDFPQLELRNAPRNINAFINKLLTLTDFDITVVPVAASVMRWAEALKLALDPNCVMDTVQLSEISIAPEITGIMLLRSKRDIRKALKDIIAGRTHSIDKARISWTDGGREVTIQLGSGGSAKLDPDDMELLAALRAALPKP